MCWNSVPPTTPWQSLHGTHWFCPIRVPNWKWHETHGWWYTFMWDRLNILSTGTLPGIVDGIHSESHYSCIWDFTFRQFVGIHGQCWNSQAQFFMLKAFRCIRNWLPFSPFSPGHISVEFFFVWFHFFERPLVMSCLQEETEHLLWETSGYEVDAS